MVKDNDTVIQFVTRHLTLMMHAYFTTREFNELVNMSADELKEWLGSQESESSGWTKDSSSNGETVGHESGRRIVSILSKNPKKDPNKYDVSVGQAGYLHSTYTDLVPLHL
jgi:hypothetical protein